MRALILAFVAVAAVPTSAAAGNGGFLPPLRVDVGPQISSVDPAPAFQVVAGIHWASVYPKARANIDIGVGVVSTQRPTEEDTTEPGPRALSMSVSTREREPLSLVGGYLEVATRTAGNGWWRNWVGTRVEWGRASLDQRDKTFVGVATRISTEAFLAGGTGSCSSGGIVLGVVAIGLYGELSARKIDDIGNDYGVSLGLTMRSPLIAAH